MEISIGVTDFSWPAEPGKLSQELLQVARSAVAAGTGMPLQGAETETLHDTGGSAWSRSANDSGC